MAARLTSLGRGLRPFSLPPSAASVSRSTKPGGYTVLARATNRIGQTQAASLIFNPAGYHNNVPLPLTVNVA